MRVLLQGSFLIDMMSFMHLPTWNILIMKLSLCSLLGFWFLSGQSRQCVLIKGKEKRKTLMQRTIFSIELFSIKDFALAFIYSFWPLLVCSVIPNHMYKEWLAEYTVFEAASQWLVLRYKYLMFKIFGDELLMHQSTSWFSFISAIKFFM